MNSNGFYFGTERKLGEEKADFSKYIYRKSIYADTVEEEALAILEA